jgi:hypothetical protein
MSEDPLSGFLRELSEANSSCLGSLTTATIVFTTLISLAIALVVLGLGALAGWWLAKRDLTLGKDEPAVAKPSGADLEAQEVAPSPSPRATKPPPGRRRWRADSPPAVSSAGAASASAGEARASEGKARPAATFQSARKALRPVTIWASVTPRSPLRSVMRVVSPKKPQKLTAENVGAVRTPTPPRASLSPPNIRPAAAPERQVAISDVVETMAPVSDLLGSSRTPDGQSRHRQRHRHRHQARDGEDAHEGASADAAPPRRDEEGELHRHHSRRRGTDRDDAHHRFKSNRRAKSELRRSQSRKAGEAEAESAAEALDALEALAGSDPIPNN